MQIHEITKKSLREGFFGDLKKVGSALKPSMATGSGFIQGLSGADFVKQRDSDSANLEKATRARARQLAQQWEKLIKSQSKPKPAQSNPSASDTNWRQDALKSSGAAFGQASATRPAPGQMPAAVAASAQGQRMMQAYGQPRGGVQSIKEAPQEYTTPSGIVVPAGTKTDPGALGIVDFERWADQQLTTQITGTGQKIDLDAVKKDPAVKAELDKVLPQIRRDPTATAAVEQYFLIAMQAMQQMASAVKQKQISGLE